jgi:FAD binding domain
MSCHSISIGPLERQGACHRMRRWQDGRVILIADAARASSPNAGRGASLALEDAIYLAKLLRDCAGGYWTAFERFEHARKPHVERVVTAGVLQGDRHSADIEKQELNYLLDAAPGRHSGSGLGGSLLRSVRVRVSTLGRPCPARAAVLLALADAPDRVDIADVRNQITGKCPHLALLRHAALPG